MLNIMRKQAGSWMIKVILFAIVIVFVFWGVGSFNSRDASKVATVNGEIIKRVDYQRTYNNLIDQYRQRFGASLNDGMLEMLQVKSQAVNQLIDRTLLLQEARRLDLEVPASEVAEAIVKIPAFQTNGTFDRRRYQTILSRIHLSPEEFEADQKNAMLVEKLSRVIMGAAKVSDMEARQFYDWQNTSVNVAYVLFKPEEQTDVVLTDEAIAEYYDANKENYKTDPMVKAAYVVFDPADDEKQVTVADDEIRDYYDTHTDEFSAEKKVEARHVLIKVPQDADADADEAARSKAQEVTDKAKAGEDFAELAKTYSEGPTKDRGGYLGEFTRNQMIKPFADKAFSMAAGEVSDPVKTQFGWHVIKVEKVTDATTQTLDEARPAIVKTLTERKARNRAYDRAEQFYDSTFEKDDLADVARQAGLTPMETGAFSRRGPDALGRDKTAFASAAFELSKNQISDIKEIGNRFYLIQVTDTIDAAIPALETVKTRVAADLKKQRQREEAHAAAEKMAAELKQNQTLDGLAEAMGRTVKQTGLFKRDGAVPAVGSDPAFIQAAFALKSAGAVSETPVEGTAGFYLLSLTQRQPPSPDAYEGQKKTITDRLIGKKRQKVFQDWMSARRDESEIAVESAYLK
jgi:peptidyl-prolyl cis-trans isomerase D